MGEIADALIAFWGDEGKLDHGFLRGRRARRW